MDLCGRRTTSWMWPVSIPTILITAGLSKESIRRSDWFWWTISRRYCRRDYKEVSLHRGRVLLMYSLLFGRKYTRPMKIYLRRSRKPSDTINVMPSLIPGFLRVGNIRHLWRRVSASCWLPQARYCMMHSCHSSLWLINHITTYITPTMRNLFLFWRMLVLRKSVDVIFVHQIDKFTGITLAKF